MCGIAGFIGRPKNPRLSAELTSKLFETLEMRGTDASGVWGTQNGNQGKILYYKNAKATSLTVQEKIWKDINAFKTDLMLLHARAVSKSGGSPYQNGNNHPFVSADKRIGMVHNGSLDESSWLSKKYQIDSKTDSEYLLRIFEHGMDHKLKINGVDSELCKRISGISDIWSHISSGAMAVAIGEKTGEHSRTLLLFRNDLRPLWVVDLRKQLGQIFFVSYPDVWYKVMDSNPKLEQLCLGGLLAEVPSKQIWVMRIDKDHPVVTSNNLMKFDVKVHSTGTDISKHPYLFVKKAVDNKPAEKLFPEKFEALFVDPTRSTLQYNPQSDYRNELAHRISKRYESDYYNAYQELESESGCYKGNQGLDRGCGESGNCVTEEYDELCNEIVSLTKNIQASVSNMSQEYSIHSGDYQVLLESLRQIKADLDGTFNLVDH